MVYPMIKSVTPHTSLTKGAKTNPMTNPIWPDHVYQIKTVGDPALSPDGMLLAYTLGWADNEALESRSRVILMDLGSGSWEEFTQGQRDSAPKFSPDGRQLAFLRSEGGGPAQVWALGSAGGEARQLTHAAKGVFDYAWSPDGKSMAVCSDVDPEAGDGPSGESAGPDSVPRVTVVRRVRYRYDTV